MAQPKDIPKEKYISRIEIEPSNNRGATFGWQVRFPHEGKEITRFYADFKYGDMYKSFQEAKNFRDSFFPDFQQIMKKKANVYPEGFKKEIGILFIKGDPKSKPGTYSSYWRAQWTDEKTGERITKNFFIATHGIKKAYELAVKARMNAIKTPSSRLPTIYTIFTPPQKHSIKIWRYLDFTKFVSLLEAKSLFFVFSENLKDPFEGSLSSVNKDLRPSLFEKKFFKSNINRTELRGKVAVNCWHINAHESAAMWKLYAKTHEAVCIQSTYELLRNELEPIFKVSTVKYMDYNSDWIPESHPLSPFVFKRKSFEHENELRALIDAEEIEKGLSNLLGIEFAETGIYKKVNISDLIKNMYVAPEAPDWFFDLIKKVLDRYKLSNIPVIRSSLESEPFF